MANSTLNGIEIIVEGNSATCGHPAASLNPFSAPKLNGKPIILTNSDLVGGGVIIPSNVHTAKINGLLIAIHGESVTSHGSSPHDTAIILAG